MQTKNVQILADSDSSVGRRDPGESNVLQRVLQQHLDTLNASRPQHNCVVGVDVMNSRHLRLLPVHLRRQRLLLNVEVVLRDRVFALDVHLHVLVAALAVQYSFDRSLLVGELSVYV